MDEDIKKTINKIIFTHATTKQRPTISRRLVLLKRGGYTTSGRLGDRRRAKHARRSVRLSIRGGLRGSGREWSHLAASQCDGQLRVPTGAAAHPTLENEFLCEMKLYPFDKPRWRMVMPLSRETKEGRLLACEGCDGTFLKKGTLTCGVQK